MQTARWSSVALLLASLAVVPSSAFAAPSSTAKPAAKGTAAPPVAKLQAPPRKAEVPIEELSLPNGMRLLLARRPEQATVMAGWVAHVGSANERPGITGVAHFFEHMMFKGTRTIGTRDAKRDGEIIAEQENLQNQIRAIYAQQRARYRRGEIDDVFDPKNRPPELVELEARFSKLVEEQRALMVKEEYDKVYSEAGGSGINATTNWDSTMFWVTVPANKLELWFWMESDRLAQPVFREFYAERDVVQEERRMRIESTPTGKFDEQLNAMFWTSHPYKWDTIGWMSDLKTLSLADAQDFFSTYYVPGNITAILVGNFDPVEARSLATKYFGRIPASTKPIPDVVTLEEPQLAERRLEAECDCQPQLELRFHTAPFEHKDSYPLEVVESLLNGQTGRLNRDLILDRKIASSASASQEPWKYNGFFVTQAETRGDAKPADLEAALVAELDRLKREPVPAEELQKVKNQAQADAFRRLQNPFFLLVQLLYYDGRGDWRYLSTWSERMAAVTAADVQRVAAKYFTKENRTVATYLRKAGAASDDVPPELAALKPEVRQRVMAQIRQIRQVTDAAQLEQALAGIAAGRAQVPPEMKGALDALEKAARERLEELKKENAAKEVKP